MTDIHVPQQAGTNKMRYVVFGSGGFYDIYLVRDPNPRTWTFINRFTSLLNAASAVRGYLAARAAAKQLGRIR